MQSTQTNTVDRLREFAWGNPQSTPSEDELAQIKESLASARTIANEQYSKEYLAFKKQRPVDDFFRAAMIILRYGEDQQKDAVKRELLQILDAKEVHGSKTTKRPTSRDTTSDTQVTLIRSNSSQYWAAYCLTEAAIKFERWSANQITASFTLSSVVKENENGAGG